MNLSLKTIANHELFLGLEKETINILTQNAILKKYHTGEIVAHQGDVWPYLFLVMEGEVNAKKESIEGRTFVATTLHPRDIFWGLAFFIENAKMPVMLQAVSTSSVYLWSHDDLQPIIQNNGSIAWKLCQMMINRMQLASDIVDELAFQPVMGRLAHLLLDVFKNAEDEFMARDMTLDEMAERIGTTREVVCRHLYKFAEKGAIEIRRTELKINDRGFLETQIGK